MRANPLIRKALCLNGRFFGVIGTTLVVSMGCAQDPPPAPVAPVVVKVTADTFCQTMRRLYGPTGKPGWDVADTTESITRLRRLGRAYDSNCASPQPRNPTS